MREPHPQSHVTHRSRHHVTNQKRFTSTSTRSQNLVGCWVRMRGPHLCNDRVQTCFVYLTCENVFYWYTIVICRNQRTIFFIPTHSTTIADYSSINYLLQVLVFLVKIGILSTVSGSKKSKFKFFLDYFLLTSHMKRYLIWFLFDILRLRSIRFTSITLIHFNFMIEIYLFNRNFMF